MAERSWKLFEDKLWQSSYLLIPWIVAYVQSGWKRQEISHCRWVIFSGIGTSSYMSIKRVGWTVQCEKIWIQCLKTSVWNKWAKKVNILELVKRDKWEIQSVVDSHNNGIARNRWDKET